MYSDNENLTITIIIISSNKSTQKDESIHSTISCNYNSGKLTYTLSPERFVTDHIAVSVEGLSG